MVLLEQLTRLERSVLSKHPLQKAQNILHIAGLLLAFLACNKPKETQNLEIQVTSPGIGVVSQAQISIDGRLVGASNSQGIWRARIALESGTKHRISVAVEKEGYYFSPWAHEFTADGRPLSKVANLFSVPKLTGSQVVSETLESETPPSQAMDPLALWRKSYTKYVSSLPPMMPWTSTYDKGEDKAEDDSSSENSQIEKTIQRSTFYIHAQSLAQEGAQFWTGPKIPENICTTNRRGRCTVELAAEVTSLLVTKDGFKSILARPRGDGTHYLKMERGFSRDLFVAAREEGWKITSKGLELVRGVGPGFVVFDQDGDNLYIECAKSCSSKPQLISWAPGGITTVKPNFAEELLPLRVENPFFAGDYFGTLDQEFTGITEAVPDLLKKNGFRKPSKEDTNLPGFAFGIVKNRSSDDKTDGDFLLEALFLSPKGDILGASLKSCAHGGETCFKQVFEQALENSRPVKSKDRGLARREEIKENKDNSPVTEVLLTDGQGQAITGARIYVDGIYLGRSRDKGEILVPSLGSKTLEVVKDGYGFYRSYVANSKSSIAISLSNGTSVVLSKRQDAVAALYQGGLEIGKLPGVYAVKPISFEVDPGENQKKVNLIVKSGSVADISLMKFYPDLYAVWEKQVLAGDLSGAEKTLEQVTKDHPDWIPLAYIRNEKQYVEKGLLSEDWNNPSLANYPTARWLKAKASAQMVLDEAKQVEEVRSLENMFSDIFLVSGAGPSQEFFSELHYLRSLAQLKASMISGDQNQSDVALRKVNEWFELGYGSQSESFGRRMWNLAREQSFTNKRGM